MANRNECFSDFSKQKTAKERCHSLVSRMGDREENLETPLLLPRVCTDVRSLARSLLRWRHNQIFSAWWVTNFSYPWCFAGALRALKLRYKNVQSCTINNSVRSAASYFPLERGVRQGDPLSPYLFIVVVETLAIAIHQNQGIRGISIENEETKILQYADDITAVLSDISSAEQLLELLNFLRIFQVLIRSTAKKRRAGGLGRLKRIKQIS